VKLPHLDEWNTQRRAIAHFYNTHLSPLPLQLPHENRSSTHVYHVYQIQHAKREKILESLIPMGISVTIHYPVALHLHQGFSSLGYQKGNFPIAENLACRTLSLPCYPGMTEEQTEYIVSGITKGMNNWND
jgi:dTDP-4-amino-4,6-dideoxygalactose transaminase